jgi:glucose-1-phosphate thymidylyltransferase
MRREDAAVSLGDDQAAAAARGMKGMIPIGRPFLDYILSALADAGFTRVCLVIGPEHDAVLRHYTIESPPTHIAIAFATQEKPLGTADAVVAAQEFCGEESFIAINSDNYYPAEALRALRETGAPAIAGFARSTLISRGNVPQDRVSRFGALTIDREGFLVRIVPREGDQQDSAAETYASMNCWLFDSQIFEACRRVTMSPRNELELPRAVQLAIDTMGMKMKVVKLRLPVLDMSTRADIAGITKHLEGIDVRL